MVPSSKSDSFGDDRALSAALREGSPEAFEALHERTHRMVYGTAFHWLRSKEEALDVSQEVYLKAAQRLPIEREIRNLGGWLFRITVNLCRDRLRALRRRGHGNTVGENTFEYESIPARTPAPDRLVASRETAARVTAALGQLSDMQREVVTLCIEQGASRGEAARLLGTSEESIRVVLWKARQRLRRVLSESADLRKNLR